MSGEEPAWAPAIECHDRRDPSRISRFCSKNNQESTLNEAQPDSPSIRQFEPQRTQFETAEYGVNFLLLCALAALRQSLDYSIMMQGARSSIQTCTSIGFAYACALVRYHRRLVGNIVAPLDPLLVRLALLPGQFNRRRSPKTMSSLAPSDDDEGQQLLRLGQ